MGEPLGYHETNAGSCQIASRSGMALRSTDAAPRIELEGPLGPERQRAILISSVNGLRSRLVDEAGFNLVCKPMSTVPECVRVGLRPGARRMTRIATSRTSG